MIEIENGCVKVVTAENTWNYTYMSVGPDRRTDTIFNSITFVTANGEAPEIGDFINNGKLVKRTTPKVNSDWSRWKDKDLYGNP